MILGADDEVFSASALIQMAGRAGRAKERPTGTVCFFVGAMSQRVREALHQIAYMNQKGRGCLLKCLLCGATIESRPTLKQLLLPGKLPEPRICPQCRSHLLLRSNAHPCPGCGRILAPKESICWECRQWQRQYGWLLNNHSLYVYNGLMREFMKNLSFKATMACVLFFKRRLIFFCRNLRMMS